jgi:hypothetical protein
MSTHFALSSDKEGGRKGALGTCTKFYATAGNAAATRHTTAPTHAACPGNACPPKALHQQLHSHQRTSQIHAFRRLALARAHHRPTTGLLLRLQKADRGHVRRRYVRRRQVRLGHGRLAGRLAAPGAPLRDCAGVGGVVDARGPGRGPGPLDLQCMNKTYAILCR